MKRVKADACIIYEKGYVMIFINFFYCLGELCGIGNIAYYMLCPCGIITLVEASSYSINQPAVCCKLPAYGFSDARGLPGYN